MKKSVLAIGLHPAAADLTAYPGLTPQSVQSYIDAQLRKLDLAGYSVVTCLIDPRESSEALAAQALQSRQFDCVVIGAGLRQPTERLLLFERIINLVHALAPAAAICFNTTPADTLDAVQRWVPPA